MAPQARLRAAWVVLAALLALMLGGSQTSLAQLDESITYKAADGSMKTISKEEAIERMQKQKNLKFDDGKLVQETSGEMSIDEIAGSNPHLGHFIRVGQFAHEQLNNLGYAFGNMTDLTSSPRPSEHEKAPQRGIKLWELTQILTIEEMRFHKGKKVKRAEKYETVVRFDKQNIKAPHLGLVQAWLLNSADKRTQDIECPPPPRPSFIEDNASKFMTFFGVAIFTAVIRMLRIGLNKLLFPEKNKAEEPSKEPSKDGGPEKQEKAKSQAQGKSGSPKKARNRKHA